MAFKFRDLLHDQVAVSLCRNNEDVVLRYDLQHPVISVPDECLSGFGYIKELLRLIHLADRSESGSRSTGHDDAITVVYVHYDVVLY